MCETYELNKFNLVTQQTNEVFAVSHRRPRLQIRQDKIMALKLSTFHVEKNCSYIIVMVNN